MSQVKGGRVGIVDYGVINLRNIVRGFEHIDAEVYSSQDGDELLRADRLVLPGVGAFGSGVGELRRLGLDKVVMEFSASGKPVLGICLGMQLLFESSNEYGEHEGLGIIEGTVVPIPSGRGDEGRRKIPHIGWNTLLPYKGGQEWRGTCFGNSSYAPSCYFVHSFMVKPENSEHVLAVTDYEGASIVAAVQSNNVIGMQFHPERSGPVGLQMLKDFLLE
ncbi:MAG: imidazole glycerol phosphate synthase subunit HisH [Alphaproteobacteria bacterium]|nr:imidazole glycerol phosphate synthase subunit HisH [Alphaproteobacteria bacterium]